MAPVRARRGSLVDMINLDDLDAAVDDLLDMNEQEFTRAVLLYLEGDRLGRDAMRDPEVIERTYDTIDSLLHSNRRRWQDGDNTRTLSRLIESLDVERKAIRAEALAAREARVREQQGEHEVAYAARVNARLERALDKQRALRAQIEQAQRKGIDARALAELKKRHLREFLDIKRDLKRQDAAEAAQREGAADPAGESTAPSVPNQAARS